MPDLKNREHLMELIRNVIKNLNVQQKIEKVKYQQPLYYSGLLDVGLGIFLAIISASIFPWIILPIGFILSGGSLRFDSKTEYEVN
jgi:hypothetical protein